MIFDAAVFGIVVTVLFALLGLAYGYGSLQTRVKNNKFDIDVAFKDFKEYQKENKSDHNAITAKLDRILVNGRNKGEH